MLKKFFFDLPQHATLRRLLNLRILALFCQLIGLLLAQTVLAVSLPFWPIAAIMLIALLFTAWTAWRMRDAQPMGAAGMFGQLLADLLNWSALLYVCGGATNPFVSFYLAILAVAAAILPARWVALLAFLSLLAYSLLSYFYWPLQLANHDQAISYHLAGMWVNFALSALVIAWFVTRISATLHRRDAQLAQARERQLQNAQVLALGTQAASAAHAIATPLSSIAVIAGELRYAALHDAGLQPYLEDLQLIESQIALCQQGLEQMRSQHQLEQDSGAPLLVPWLTQFLQQWRLQHPQSVLHVDLSLPTHMQHWQQHSITPANAYAQILQTLLDNAAAATVAGQSISVHLQAQAQELQICVTDQGPGMSAELLARLGHAPVESSTGGQGIGVWLACATAHQIGAKLVFFSNSKNGTRAVLSLAK